MSQFVPKKLFLTRGVGRHREHLNSFEEALRDAGIAYFNLVTVSSIFPPHCKIITKDKGLAHLDPGQIVYCVMSRAETNENRRLIAASIGLAKPKNKAQFGYLSEHHSYGENEKNAGDYAEDIAAEMLATVLGVDFDSDLAWDAKREIWKISGKIIGTHNITQSAIGNDGQWTTVVTAAVFVP